MDIPRIHAISGKHKTFSEGVVNPYRYCGEYYDVYSNMYYLRNRFYNPRIGRFTSIDPVKDGSNWYVYCGNNPVNYIDPNGLEQVMLRYIIEKNGGTVTWNETTGTVGISMPGFNGIETSGQIVNGRTIVNSDWLMDVFRLTKEQATHQEGDLFHTSDDAALAFALMYHDVSRQERIEYGAPINQRVYGGETVYELGKVTNSINSAKIKTNLTDNERHSVYIVRNEFSYADIHTHWDTTGKPSFSDADYAASYSFPQIKSMYVVTPDGAIMKSRRYVRSKGFYEGYEIIRL